MITQLVIITTHKHKHWIVSRTFNFHRYDMQLYFIREIRIPPFTCDMYHILLFEYMLDIILLENIPYS